MKTRVRFAPSPTGALHIGGVRTALFSYLYAKKNNGVFILRVEDTDQSRYVKGSEEYIHQALDWSGLTPDEGPSVGGDFGPYRQSERKEIYKQHIDLLIKKGKAYYAFDKAERLIEARKIEEDNGKTFRYGAENRMAFENSLTLSDDVVKEKLQGDYVVRLMIDPGNEISIFDEIRGNILLDSSLLDDKILFKSDGMPTYHFANVVDDKLMEISCVIRGEEWLPSLPIHKLIYDAFEWDTPMFMHLPLILKPSGKGKLSKRDGDKEGFPVFPISWRKSSLGFRESGFLTEGLINYLALLGWNSGTEQEVFSFEELKQNFSINGIQKGGARFDFEKAKWINHKHIIRLSAKELISLPMVKVKLERVDSSKHLALIELIKNRLFTINDLQAEISWVSERHPYDEKVMQKLKPKGPDIILEGVSKILNECNELKNLKNLLMLWTKENEINNGLMMQCFRFALIGKLTGPDLFGICNILGKNVSLSRVIHTISYFKQKN